MLKLDHLTIIAPTLEVGARLVRQRLGVEMPIGGKHPEMGTHNCLLRMGDDLFLEVIAVDPESEAPRHPRWFGLDHTREIDAAWARGDRLNGWVVRTQNLDALLQRHGDLLGRSTRVTRGERAWQIAVPVDGSLPGGGIAPSVIDWGERGPPTPSMPDLGYRLLSFAIEHPAPDQLRRLYSELGIVDPPIIRWASRCRYRATIATPVGVRELQ